MDKYQSSLLTILIGLSMGQKLVVNGIPYGYKEIATEMRKKNLTIDVLDDFIRQKAKGGYENENQINKTWVWTT